MEAGSGGSAPVICESRLARSLTFRSWGKLISGSVKLVALSKMQRTQAAAVLISSVTTLKPSQGFLPFVLRAAASTGGKATCSAPDNPSARQPVFPCNAQRRSEDVGSLQSQKTTLNPADLRFSCLVLPEAIGGSCRCAGSCPARLG